MFRVLRRQQPVRVVTMLVVPDYWPGLRNACTQRTTRMALGAEGVHVLGERARRRRTAAESSAVGPRGHWRRRLCVTIQRLWRASKWTCDGEGQDICRRLGTSRRTYLGERLRWLGHLRGPVMQGA